MRERLSLLIWPDYVDPATLEAFERESGVGVELETIVSAVDMVYRVKSGTAHPDLLTPPEYAVRELNAARLLAPLDHSLLPNLRHLDPRFLRGRAHDPESRVSVIKDWGTTGFMYRTDKVTEFPRSWRDFWHLAERYTGRVTVLDAPGEVIGAALKMRGCSYNSCDPGELAQARLDLLQLKSCLLCFETNYRPLLASGDVWLSLGWNGDAASLIAQGIPVHYVIPSEGSQIWEDDWAMAVNAPHAASAYSFLNFLLRPEIAAQEARYTRYATANRTALTLLEDNIRLDRSTYPPQELLDRLEAGTPLTAEQQARRKAIWDEVRR